MEFWIPLSIALKFHVFFSFVYEISYVTRQQKHNMLHFSSIIVPKGILARWVGRSNLMEIEYVEKSFQFFKMDFFIFHFHGFK